MRRLMTVLLASVSCSAAFARPLSGPEQPVPPALDDQALALQFDGSLEARLDADFNGDGIGDVAAVLRDPEREKRWLVVALGFHQEGGIQVEPIDGMAMDPYPLGNAGLSVKKGVLLVEDLTGGTSAIASTYRYRYDGEEHRMRLIGDDVQYYSRTNSHDSIRISTNWLTGLRIRGGSRLTDAGDYAPLPEVREKVETWPIFMDTSPNPAVTLGLGGEE